MCVGGVGRNGTYTSPATRLAKADVHPPLLSVYHWDHPVHEGEEVDFGNNCVIPRVTKHQ